MWNATTAVWQNADSILRLLKKCQCLHKVWVNKSKTVFCPVFKYWQFGCSEVYKIEQVKCPSQRWGTVQRTHVYSSQLTLHAVPCHVYRVSLHMTLVNCSEKTLQTFLWPFTSFHGKALAEVMSKSHPYSMIESWVCVWFWKGLLEK